MSNNKVTNTARQPSSRQKRATPSANTPKSGTTKDQYSKSTGTTQSPKSGYSSANSPKASRAKKLIVRAPNQEIVKRSRNLKEKREDLEKIEPMRVQKVLAASGAGSRREMEQWVSQGMVQINGKVATLGDKVGPQDRVTVKGNSIKLKWPDRLPRILIYYKQVNHYCKL